MNIGSYSAALDTQSLAMAAAKASQISSASTLGEGRVAGADEPVGNLISTRPVVATDAASALQNSPSASQVSNDAGSSGNEGAVGDEKSRQQEVQQRAELQQQQQEIQQLSARDREVRAHEQAHAAVGGQYAGAPRYQYERGPDGVRYAVGGEVSIDVGPAATASETIQKMQTVRRAALAPAEPSPQDRRVAAQASATEAEARQELAIETREQIEQTGSSSESEAEASGVGASTEVRGIGQAEATQADSDLDARPTATPATTPEPFNSISSQLQRSIIASDERRLPGSVVNQLA